MLKVNQLNYMHPSLVYRFYFQSTICLCLLAAAYATPQGGYAVEKLPPKPFNYQYGVSDDYSKANFQKTESQDSNVRQSFNLIFH